MKIQIDQNVISKIMKDLKIFPVEGEIPNYLEWKTFSSNIKVFQLLLRGPFINSYKEKIVNIEGLNLINFSLRDFPSCCGLSIFHRFFISISCLSKDEINYLLDSILLNIKYNMYSERTKRYNAIFVEKENLLDGHRIPKTATNLDYFIKKEKRIKYQPIYDYVKGCEDVQETYFRNENTGSTLISIIFHIPSKVRLLSVNKES